MKWVGIIGGVIVVLAAITWLISNRPTQPEPASSQPQEPLPINFYSAETLAQFSATELATAFDAGEVLFNRYQCVGCHADEGRALKKLVALGNRYDIELLQAYLKRPNPPMPIFPLSDNDRRALALYLIQRYPGQPQ